jgi:Rrf2 family protein
MKRDSRLSGILHVLLHMAEAPGPVTSEHLARAMQTNPVVIRRIMAGLREDGLVRSEKGHGGGWTIARDLGAITLRDIYEALGAPGVFAMGNRTEAPGCLVEQAVNAAMDDAFAKAEALLLRRLGEVTLAALSADFHARLRQRATTCEFQEKSHAS